MTLPNVSKRNDSLDERRIEQKFTQLGLVFETLKKSLWTKEGMEGVFFNPFVARNVAVSYLHDLDRMKDYHYFKFVDETKMAAYWTKWILELKPIQFSLPGLEVTEDHLLANEKFAFYMSTACLKISPAILSREYVRLLLYTWHYRQYEADAALPAFDLFWRLSKAVANGSANITKPL
jgi:hypothetical protein